MNQRIQALILPGATGISVTPEKSIVIRLRWPVVIISSFLLIYSDSPAFTPSKLHGFVLFYLFSNAILYLIDDKLFGSAYFYAPLVIFDTLCLSIATAIAGQFDTEFFIALFLTILLCSVARDLQGLLIVAGLGPVVYGYFLFKAGGGYDPSVYLRVPFPFVISLFYGYFVQVEQAHKKLEGPQGERPWAKSSIQSLREREGVLHEIASAVTSTLGVRSVLELLLEKIDRLFPYAATAVWLINEKTGELEPVTCRNVDTNAWKAYQKRGLNHTMVVFRDKVPVTVRNAIADPGTHHPTFYLEHGLVFYLGLPLITKGEALGVLAFYTREKHQFSEEEIEFVSTMAGQAAIAIHNSRLFEKVKRQAVELTELNLELDKSNEAKNEFLSVMSHELRTPLNVIVGYVGMIKDGLLGEVNPEQAKALEKVIYRTNDQLTIVNNMLFATVLDTEKIKIESHTVNLKDLVNDLQSAYETPLNKDVALKWECSPEPSVIMADSGKLKHILQNLVDNALKFTEKGTVTISAGHDPSAKTVGFKVADTGVGIPKEHLPFIFEKFRQVDSSETRLYGGVGMGLYIVRKFTELLGGTVEVESEPGRGSIFTVTIPYERTEE